jgi:hypothetical protein
LTPATAATQGSDDQADATIVHAASLTPLTHRAVIWGSPGPGPPAGSTEDCSMRDTVQRSRRPNQESDSKRARPGGLILWPR